MIGVTLRHRAADIGARIGVKDVEPPGAGQKPRQHGRHRRPVHQVERHGMGACPHLGHQRRQPFPVAVDQDDFGRFGHHRPRAGQTNPRRRPRYRRCLALQPPGHAAPLSRPISPYCRALLRRKGRPRPITSSALAATGRQTDRPWAISGGMLTKLSIASPPSNPMAAKAAKIASQSQVPSPGVPRSDSDRWM